MLQWCEGHCQCAYLPVSPVCANVPWTIQMLFLQRPLLEISCNCTFSAENLRMRMALLTTAEEDMPNLHQVCSQSFSMYLFLFTLKHLTAGHLCEKTGVCKYSSVMNASWPANTEVSEKVIVVYDCLHQHRIPPFTIIVIQCDSYLVVLWDRLQVNAPKYHSCYCKTSTSSYLSPFGCEHPWFSCILDVIFSL